MSNSRAVARLEVLMNRARLLLVVLTASALPLACGGPEALPTATSALRTVPAPVATAAPTTIPAPTAAPSGLCANGNTPVAWFDIKVYAVRDKHGDLRVFNPGGPFFVGESLRFDSQGKDKFGRRTDGCTGEGPRWSWGPDELAAWNGVRGWMPSAKVLAAGTFSVTARFEDGTLVAPLDLVFE